MHIIPELEKSGGIQTPTIPSRNIRRVQMEHCETRYWLTRQPLPRSPSGFMQSIYRHTDRGEYESAAEAGTEQEVIRREADT